MKDFRWDWVYIAGRGYVWRNKHTGIVFDQLTMERHVREVERTLALMPDYEHIRGAFTEQYESKLREIRRESKRRYKKDRACYSLYLSNVANVNPCKEIDKELRARERAANGIRKKNFKELMSLVLAPSFDLYFDTETGKIKEGYL